MRKKNSFMLIIFCLLFFSKINFAQDFNEPSDDELIIKNQSDPSFIQGIFHNIIRFYQKYISPLDGGRCPMYPTCSAYSIEANKKYGMLTGYVMTVDRLIHEAEEQKFVPKIKKYDHMRSHDPVSNNDFWFNNNKE